MFAEPPREQIQEAYEAIVDAIAAMEPSMDDVLFGRVMRASHVLRDLAFFHRNMPTEMSDDELWRDLRRAESMARHPSSQRDARHVDNDDEGV